MPQKTKGLVLLSGGLDSTLAVRIVQDQGIDVEALNYKTPFCLCDKCSVAATGKKFGVKIHNIFLGQDYLDLVANPPHGYGSNMNPCIDCRILMFKYAKKIANKIGAEFIVTGEVLDERPFSQRKHIMFLIEREAGLEGKILRPLSAKLLPETDIEKSGLIDREKLFEIKGRRRLPQIQLTARFGITDYPCPSGGCLLTDPKFADRLRDHLRHNSKLKLDDITLLKLGRHLRLDGGKIVVGRNEEENRNLLSIAKQKQIPYCEVIEYVGPITLLIGNMDEKMIKKAAAITVRYSDAPKEIEVRVRYMARMEMTIIATGANDKEIEKLRI